MQLLHSCETSKSRCSIFSKRHNTSFEQKNEHRVKWIRNDNDNRMVSMRNPGAVVDRETIIVIKIPFYFLSNAEREREKKSEVTGIDRLVSSDYNG